MPALTKCNLCGVSVVVKGNGTTKHYSLHPKIREAMDVINGVQEALWHQWKDNEVLYGYSLQLELALKRLNKHVLGVDKYYESDL